MCVHIYAYVNICNLHIFSYVHIYYQLCNHFSVDVVTIPAPVQLPRQINADDIEMQSSPAYASLDNKSP